MKRTTIERYHITTQGLSPTIQCRLIWTFLFYNFLPSKKYSFALNIIKVLHSAQVKFLHTQPKIFSTCNKISARKTGTNETEEITYKSDFFTPGSSYVCVHFPLFGLACLKGTTCFEVVFLHVTLAHYHHHYFVHFRRVFFIRTIFFRLFSLGPGE